MKREFDMLQPFRILTYLKDKAHLMNVRYVKYCVK